MGIVAFIQQNHLCYSLAPLQKMRSLGPSINSAEKIARLAKLKSQYVIPRPRCLLTAVTWSVVIRCRFHRVHTTLSLLD